MTSVSKIKEMEQELPDVLTIIEPNTRKATKRKKGTKLLKRRNTNQLSKKGNLSPFMLATHK